MQIKLSMRALGIAGLLLATLAGPLAAQPAWPTRAVKFVVPSNAGGSPDRVTRLLAERLSKKWGQPTVVENKAGATSIIGTDFVAKSPADGYTMLSTFTSLVQVPALFKRVPYDTERDLVAVTQTVAVDVLFLVRADSPYKTLQDFAAAAKTAKPPLSYGSFGNGSSFHIYGEKLAQSMGVDLTHVPYKGELPSTTDLLGGQLSSSFASVGTALPFLTDGRLRPLGVASTKRSPVLPNVPTLGELGMNMPDLVGWFGVLAPAGTPAPIIQKVATDIREILTQPDVVKILRDQGLEPVASSPEAFQRRLNEDLVQWKKLLPEVGIKPAD
ncbi:Bug family tripartite tricarboxylate transporter substrate binding protein [Ottowia thiooxydans]|uniref:Tripartite-type tricarboxylate transporter receptor subunit TctC n=1 Tax=Ottowia thiooxydans TaxID=219182 RepID=A0ABV2Q316_9BURK